MNEDKFSGKADIYARFRPTYPDEALDYLYTDAGLSEESVVADIGSGTGILTELLLRRGSFVYGVEPNGDMRRTAEQSLAEYTRFRSVNASAEHTGLPASSVDFVTAAQSFHWFDRAAFKTECRRILKSGGKAALLWNSRDSQSALVAENDAVNRAFCPSFKGFSGGMRGEGPGEYNDFFRNNCAYCVIRHDLVFDEDSFIGRNMSASYAPAQTDSRHADYIAALRELFRKYGSGGQLLMPNLTRIYVGEV